MSDWPDNEIAEAYEIGFEEGAEQGYEQGFEEAHDQFVEQLRSVKDALAASEVVRRELEYQLRGNEV